MLGVETQPRDRRISLFYDIHERQPPVKGDVPRTRARPKRRIAALDALQRPLLEVHSIHEKAIDAEVGGERVAVRRIGDDTMGMRRLLTLPVRSLAVMLID